ncbi:MAG: efflux RND transporter permease subunit, partial [Verrucomicrobiales bacterium]|nr:efflux RND transporter permease subunit [Verrucomicrobiales bacterium]
NQQIIFTGWMGRSPQDVEDQITYPLTAALLGVPKVKTVRSYSYFGFSSIYLIFEEDAEFYWSRSRILEKLNSLPTGTLPPEVAPTLGPDATALGQVFWYTLEGRDKNGAPTPGWTPEELRTIQDYQVRYALQGVEGVAEVASIGGFQQEYQIDVNPDAMRAYDITLDQVFSSVRNSNLDVGARTIEINKAEYIIRGLGFIKNLDDIRQTVVAQRDNVPVTIDQIAAVSKGPALRRGALDKDGAEAVGGVVVARYGANPLATIQAVKEQIEKIVPGMPNKTLADGRVSTVTVVPFYDRTGLIEETLDTLNAALSDELLVTVLVVLLLVFHLRSSVIISLTLPLAVLFTFIAMKLFGVDANVVALSGIAIAIGTIVDMGIVLCENTLNRISSHGESESRLESVVAATTEVGGAVLTAVLTTVVGFLPVFAMEGAEGKLFRPLAFTKTFALVASVVVALTLIPTLAHLFYRRRIEALSGRSPLAHHVALALAALTVAAILFTRHPWLPVVAVLLLILFHGFIKVYPALLAFFLRWKLAILAPVAALVTSGGFVWSNLGKEFMPSLDEGSFLWMPTVMPHASIGEAMDVLKLQDRAIRAIPEVDQVVGKLGRADTALDPAPVSMFETVISYKPEFTTDDDGNTTRNWRDHIHSPADIWDEIAAAATVPGSTSAPKLQPIETRLIMLQTGMRAPMGLKVYGPDLETIEAVAL